MNNSPLGLAIIFHLILILFFKIKERLSLGIAVVTGIILISFFFFNVFKTLTTYFPSLDEKISNSITKPLSCPSREIDQTKKKIILRIDDFQAYAWTDISLKMLAETKQRNIPSVLGVIPLYLDEDKKSSELLKDNLCNVEIALHGWDHSSNPPEFSQLNFNQASEKIKKGVAVLQNVVQQSPTSFIPPENVISDEAEKAVFSYGFKVLSTNEGKMLDAATGTFDYVNKSFVSAEKIINDCKSVLSSKDICVVMLHPQDYATNGKYDDEKFSQFVMLLEAIEKNNWQATTFADYLLSQNTQSNSINVSLRGSLGTWIADWNFDNTIEEVNKTRSIGNVSPFLYEVTIDGKIKPIDSKIFAGLRKLPDDVAITPTIVNRLDKNIIHGFLQNASEWNQTIEFLVNEGKRNNFKGFDVDFEYIDPKLKNNYLQFVKRLSEQLHKNDLTLILSLPIRTTSQEDNDFVAVYDWKILGELADEIRIMAYDYHHTKTQPGSLIPVSILEQTLSYARRFVPSEKLVLALPTYGYDWQKNKVDSLYFSDITRLASEHKVQPVLDEESLSMKLSYTDKNKVDHEIWFENATTLEMKMQISTNLGVKKFFFWRLGDQDPKMESMFKVF